MSFASTTWSLRHLLRTSIEALAHTRSCTILRCCRTNGETLVDEATRLVVGYLR